MSKLRILDLFSGIGGFSLGLERTGGFETVAFCEIDEFKRRVLAKHWPEVPQYHDVTKLTGDILDRDGITADVITGGFPCQDISASGSGAGIKGDRSGLFFEIIRIARQIRPNYIIMENSPNLIGGNDGGWAAAVFGGLAQIGYDAEWRVIPASDFGAPHKRERVWIIAYPSGVRQSGPWEFADAINATSNAFRQADQFVSAFHAQALPFVCGGHDGVPNGMEQLIGYGDAVVPDIPEFIGHTILQAEVAQ